MEILEWDTLLKMPRTEQKPSAMTIGVFDGVHRGHTELIRRVVAKGPCPTVISFRENPKKILDPASYKGDIFSLRQKLEAFEALGAERAVLIDFSENFSKIKGEDFINLLVVKFDLSFLAIGNNFRCGFRRGHSRGDGKSEDSPPDTDAASVKKMNEARGIETEIVPPVLEALQPVSSSRIRAAITAGDLGLAAALLGRDYELDLGGLTKERAEFHGEEGWVYDAASLHRIIPAQGRYKVRFNTGKTGISSAPAVIDILKEKGKVFIPGPDADSIEIIVFPIGVI